MATFTARQQSNGGKFGRHGVTDSSNVIIPVGNSKIYSDEIFRAASQFLFSINPSSYNVLRASAAKTVSTALHVR